VEFVELDSNKPPPYYPLREFGVISPETSGGKTIKMTD
jgi:hypothetical protein